MAITGTSQYKEPKTPIKSTLAGTAQDWFVLMQRTANPLRARLAFRTKDGAVFELAPRALVTGARVGARPVGAPPYGCLGCMGAGLRRERLLGDADDEATVDLDETGNLVRWLSEAGIVHCMLAVAGAQAQVDPQQTDFDEKRASRMAPLRILQVMAT